MDPATIAVIASSAISVLTPFLKKSSEKLADKVADDVIEKRGQIWETVKGLFVEDELITLNLLEKYPENKDIQSEIKGKLEEKLAARPEIAEQLGELLKALPASEIKQNTMNITGDGNVGVQDVSGTVNINR